MTTPAEAVDRPDEHAGEPGPPAPYSLAVGLLLLGRPRQWIKNLLVFVAPAAAGVLFHRTAFWHTVAAFGIFCVAASGTYFLNDAFDADADRSHPSKRLRPVAAGVVPVPLAVGLGVGLLVVSVGPGRAAGRLAPGPGHGHLRPGQRGLLPRAQERADPRPGRGQRRLRPAGRGRRRGHRHRPVQLVPHRGLVRIAAHRDRASGRARSSCSTTTRPTTARSGQTLGSYTPTFLRSVRTLSAGGDRDRLLPVGVRAGRPGPPRPRSDLVPADHRALHHRPAPRDAHPRHRGRRRPRGAGPPGPPAAALRAVLGWRCSPSASTADERAPTLAGPADRVGPHRADRGRGGPRRPPRRRGPGHGRRRRTAAAGGPGHHRPGPRAQLRRRRPERRRRRCSTPPGWTPSIDVDLDAGVVTVGGGREPADR